MYYIYVLYNQEKFYVGFTRDLKRRLKEHSEGKVYSTSRYNKSNLRLVYAEIFEDQKDAQRREKYLKTTKGRKGLRLILRETLK